MLPALAAAAVVEGAAGLLAAAVAAFATQGDAGNGPPAIAFAACAIAAVASNLVLLPGWVWARGPLRPLALLRRAFVAALALCLAAVAGLALGIGATVLTDPLGPLPEWLGMAVLVLLMAPVGALVGQGAATAQRADGRPPDTQLWAGRRAHLLGCAVGVLPVLLVPVAAAGGANVLGPSVPAMWPLVLLVAPLVLALGGLPHNLLVLRDAWALREASAGPSPGKMLGRAAACGAAFCFLVVCIAAAPLPPSVRSRQPSPDGRYEALLVRDSFFGQVDTLRVVAAPGTRAARVVLEQSGEWPRAILWWRDAGTLELDVAPHGPVAAYRVVVTCRVGTCRLDWLPEGGAARDDAAERAAPLP